MDDYAEDLLRGEQPVSVPDASPTVPPPTAPAPRHNSYLSTSLSLKGISWLLWMPSAHLLLLLHL